MHIVGGGGAGTAKVGDLSVTTRVDKASPLLMQAVLSGRSFAKATLTCRKIGEDGSSPYLTIEMEEVIVTACAIDNSGGRDQFAESVSLNFARYRETYTPQMADGTAGAPVTAGWDICQNDAV